MNDRATEGKYEWSNDRVGYQYNAGYFDNWSSSEPSLAESHNPETEDCAVSRPHSYKWVMIGCEGQNQYICEATKEGSKPI